MTLPDHELQVATILEPIYKARDEWQKLVATYEILVRHSMDPARKIELLHQIGDLYERRWSGEVDLRSIKSTMKMGVLRCKTPAMVEKEVWAHLLAYNLLRTVMAVAASALAISGAPPLPEKFM